jgi:hypothetical protein
MDERGRSVWLVGIGALLSGAVSAAVVAIDGRGDLGGAFASKALTIYGPGQAALAVALAVAGALLLVTRRRLPVLALLGVIGLCAAQLAGLGLVAFRRWPLYWGCCATGHVTHGDFVRAVAVVMAVVCAVTAVACVVALVEERHLRWNGMWGAVAFPVALVVAVGGPRLVVGGWADVPGLAAWGLMYSLPFAAGLAVSALMPRLAAVVVAAAVACSALIASLGSSFLELNQPWGGARAIVVLAAVTVAASRLTPTGRRAPGERTTASQSPRSSTS